MSSSDIADGPVTLVIFGASGDLASRKLLPALYWLLMGHHLPHEFKVIAVSRSEISASSLVKTAERYLGEPANPATLKQLQSMIEVVRMDGKKANEYGPLRSMLDAAASGSSSAIRLLYLAIPPAVAMPIINALGEAGLAQPDGVVTRLLLEKPFGFDLTSAEQLDHDICKVFEPEQVFRVDHYMAKETAQNLSIFRSENPIINDVWDGQCIERVEIEATEEIGIEDRANFYEQTGALRDVIQSHLINLMALTMMKLPEDDSVHAFQAQRLNLIESIYEIDLAKLDRYAWRGQYESYRKEVRNAASTTETFAALKLHVNDPVWKDVPIWLMAGKRLAAKCTEIRVLFYGRDPKAPNWLRLRFTPREGIELELRAKRAGLQKETGPIRLRYSYPAELEHQPDGYEHVISDAISGDPRHFTTAQEVLAIWRLLEPLLERWSRSSDDLISYPAGSSVAEILGEAKIGLEEAAR